MKFISDVPKSALLEDILIVKIYEKYGIDVNSITLKRSNRIQAISKGNIFYGNCLSNLEYCIVDETKTSVPKLLNELGNIIDSNKHIEGIFRKSGSCPRQIQVQKFIDKNGYIPKNIIFNVFDACCLFKSFFSKLPEPIIPTHLWPLFTMVFHSLTSDESKIDALMYLILLLPYQNINILRYTFSLLYNVSTRCATNKMSADNLATLMTPNLLHDINSLSWKEFQPWIQIIKIYILNSGRIGVIPKDVWRTLKIKADATNSSEYVRTRMNDKQTPERNFQVQNVKNEHSPVFPSLGPEILTYQENNKIFIKGNHRPHRLLAITKSDASTNLNQNISHFSNGSEPKNGKLGITAPPRPPRKTGKQASTSIINQKSDRQINRSDNLKCEMFCHQMPCTPVNIKHQQDCEENNCKSSGARRKKNRRSGSFIIGFKHGLKRIAEKTHIHNALTPGDNLPDTKSPSAPNLINFVSEYQNSTDREQQPIAEAFDMTNNEDSNICIRILNRDDKCGALSSIENIYNKVNNGSVRKSIRNKFCKASSLSEETLTKYTTPGSSQKKITSSARKNKNSNFEKSITKSKGVLVPKGVTGVRKLFFKLASIDKLRNNEGSMNLKTPSPGPMVSHQISPSNKVEGHDSTSLEKNEKGEDKFYELSSLDFQPDLRRSPRLGGSTGVDNQSKCNLFKVNKMYNGKDNDDSHVPNGGKTYQNYNNRKSLSCSELPLLRKNQRLFSAQRNVNRPPYGYQKYSIDSIISDSESDESKMEIDKVVGDEITEREQTHVVTESNDPSPSDCNVFNKNFLELQKMNDVELLNNSRYNSPTLKATQEFLNLKIKSPEQIIDPHVYLNKGNAFTTKFHSLNALTEERQYLNGEFIGANAERKKSILRGRPNSLKSGLNLYKMTKLGKSKNLTPKIKCDILGKYLKDDTSLIYGGKNWDTVLEGNVNETVYLSSNNLENETVKEITKKLKLDESQNSKIEECDLPPTTFLYKDPIYFHGTQNPIHTHKKDEEIFENKDTPKNSDKTFTNLEGCKNNDSFSSSGNEVDDNSRYSIRCNPYKSVSEQIKRYNRLAERHKFLKLEALRTDKKRPPLPEKRVNLKPTKNFCNQMTNQIELKDDNISCGGKIHSVKKIPKSVNNLPREKECDSTNIFSDKFDNNKELNKFLSLTSLPRKNENTSERGRKNLEGTMPLKDKINLTNFVKEQVDLVELNKMSGTKRKFKNNLVLSPFIKKTVNFDIH